MKNNTVGVIFAAGRGSRLAPLTDTTPKPLIKVMGKPLIKWNLEQIVDLVSEIVIVISYLGEQVQVQVGDSFNGLPVYYANQANPKGGTLDALRTALFGSATNILSGSLLVLNSDDIHGGEIYSNFEKHISLNPELMALSATIVSDRERLKSLGVFQVDKEGKLLQIWEKPQAFVSELANSGIYYVPNDALGYINSEPNLSEKEQYITTDFFGKYALDHSIKIIPSKDTWLQISNPEDLKIAEDFFGKSR
ncbi:MAG: nucleotidyltransferase family protein [Patescibacteria group bacterium]